MSTLHMSTLYMSTGRMGYGVPIHAECTCTCMVYMYSVRYSVHVHHPQILLWVQLRGWGKAGGERRRSHSGGPSALHMSKCQNVCAGDDLGKHIVNIVNKAAESM